MCSLAGSSCAGPSPSSSPQVPGMPGAASLASEAASASGPRAHKQHGRSTSESMVFSEVTPGPAGPPQLQQQRRQQLLRQKTVTGSTGGEGRGVGKEGDGLNRSCADLPQLAALQGASASEGGLTVSAQARVLRSSISVAYGSSPGPSHASGTATPTSGSHAMVGGHWGPAGGPTASKGARKGISMEHEVFVGPVPRQAAGPSSSSDTKLLVVSLASAGPAPGMRLPALSCPLGTGGAPPAAGAATDSGAAAAPGQGRLIENPSRFLLPLGAAGTGAGAGAAAVAGIAKSGSKRQLAPLLVPPTAAPLSQAPSPLASPNFLLNSSNGGAVPPSGMDLYGSIPSAFSLGIPSGGLLSTRSSSSNLPSTDALALLDAAAGTGAGAPLGMLAGKVSNYPPQQQLRELLLGPSAATGGGNSALLAQGRKSSPLAHTYKPASMGQVQVPVRPAVMPKLSRISAGMVEGQGSSSMRSNSAAAPAGGEPGLSGKGRGAKSFAELMALVNASQGGS